MYRVFLDRVTVLTYPVAVAHGDEDRDDGQIVLYREAVCAGLQRLRLAVVIPHALLGIDKHEITLAQQLVGRSHHLLHRARMRGEGQGIEVTHQITVEAIEEIVLSYLKRVSDFVIDHEGDFVDIAIQHSRLLSRKEVAKKARQVSEAENRIKALNKIIQSLYEDKVMDKITEERFALMSETYEQERRQLKETVENSQSEIDRYDEINDNINNFVSLVVKTGRIKKLTPEIVRLLIDKVIVSEKVKTEDGYKRTVTICLAHVGEIDLP